MLTHSSDLFADMLSHIKTVSLATLDSQGLPACSYAPYVWLEGNFYLFLSGLAAHCKNLQVRPVCEIMLVEDEAEAKNLFARKRAMIRCAGNVVSRESDSFASIVSCYRQKFGPTIDMLVSLPDFTLFRLLPQCGTLVLGFGNSLPISFPPEQAVCNVS
jgi:heme iron utilization protein